MSKEVQRKPIEVSVSQLCHINMTMERPLFEKIIAAASANRITVADVVEQSLQEWLDERQSND